jgi:hypothetical protein
MQTRLVTAHCMGISLHFAPFQGIESSTQGYFMRTKCVVQ